MKGIDQKLANRVDRIFHAPMQAARRSTEPAHYFQHGPLLVYSVTHLSGSAGVTRSAQAYRFGRLYTLRQRPPGESPRHFHRSFRTVAPAGVPLMPVPTLAQGALACGRRYAGAGNRFVGVRGSRVRSLGEP